MESLLQNFFYLNMMLKSVNFGDFESHQALADD